MGTPDSSAGWRHRVDAAIDPAVHPAYEHAFLLLDVLEVYRHVTGPGADRQRARLHRALDAELARLPDPGRASS